MSRYLVLIEPSPGGFSAYSPDLPGCVAAATARDDIERVMREAIEFHLDGLRADGQPIPPPSTVASWIEVAA